MKLGLRMKILSGAALAILGYIVFTPDGSQTVEPAAGHAGAGAAAPKHEPTRNNERKARTLMADLKTTDRLVKDTVAGALFAAHSWYVAAPPPPPAPPPVAVAPPPPTAPPLPFAFMGSYKSEDGHPTFFLTAGDRVYDVKVGDTLDNTYSVDGVHAGQLLLTYMPLRIQQSLAVGDE